MNSKTIQSHNLAESIHSLDTELSERFIGLDPNGYFIIRIDHSTNELIAEHFSNDIDDIGRSIDPITGKPIGCSDENLRSPIKIYKGKSAKELGIKLTEGSPPYPISKLDHALYIGRELQRAETCLLKGETYMQD